MAKGRGGRGQSRMDKRREAEAVEAQEREGATEEAEEEADGDADAESDSEDGEDGAPKKAKKKPAKKPATPKKPSAKRPRAVKEVRRRAVWVVFDNAQKHIETFPYNQKAEAEAFLAKKIEEKKGTFYLNLFKEEIKE